MTTENPTTAVDTLFVAWQDPKSHRYYPIARLVASRNGSGPRFEFSYLRGVVDAKAAGFSLFRAFPELRETYRSDELFPLFANRLMSRSRPDFRDYAARLDLNPDVADDLEILSRSGGRRATDSLELFPLPTLGDDQRYVTYFLIHGIRYLNAFSQVRFNTLEPGEVLKLQADFQNSADRNALSLRTEDRMIVGYMPRYLVQDAWELIQRCEYDPEIRVVQVNLPPAPTQQRVLCELISCWPDSFRPFCGDEYQPLAADASRPDCE